MQLLLRAVKRTAKSGWIYHSCRGFKHTSISAHVNPIGPARTRFAPSPTGYLHLGSLRTALFNYLVAKATGGQFLLRIEDTDQKRTVRDAEARLYQDLEWAGIEWDEGPKVGGPYGPYKQSERTALYRKHAELLLQNGSAYRCFCRPERLRDLATYRQKQGLPLDYDRTCAHIHKDESDDRAAKGEAHVIRLKVPEKYPAFTDLVYGLIQQRSTLTSKPSTHEGFEDPILLKSDGFPTYHLANVVDDHHMKITHVIRGSEWMSSTPKHLAMYEAFGWEPPLFAHVGLLLDQNRNKLSKRDGSIDVASYRDKGVFPETLTNFVALLGWSHSKGKDIMSMEDLIANCTMKYTRGDTVVAFEKLWFLQRRHAARYAYSSLPAHFPDNPRHSLTELAVKPMVKLLDQRQSEEDLSIYGAIPAGEARESYVRNILIADVGNYTTSTEFIARNIYFFVRPSMKKLRKRIQSLKLHNVPSAIEYPVASATLALIRNISSIPDSEWDENSIKRMTSFIISRGVLNSLTAAREAGKLAEGTGKVVEKAWSRVVHAYLRWAVFGGNMGPDGSIMMMMLGKEEVSKRLERAERVIVRGLELMERDLAGKEMDNDVPPTADTDLVSGKTEQEPVEQKKKYKDEDWADLDEDDLI